MPESDTGAASAAGFTARIEDGLLVSLVAGGTEYIGPGTPFGRFTWRADREINVRSAFTQEGARLLLRVTLENPGDLEAVVTELALPFPMNSHFEWGVRGADRVIRHSFVSGDASFFYFSPCDGHGPFIACLPLPGTRCEMFDLRGAAGEGARPCYRALLHAAYEDGAARREGCAWRQPVSALRLPPRGMKEYGFALEAAEDYCGVRELLYRDGLPDVLAIPGMTLPLGMPARLRVRVRGGALFEPEFPGDTRINLLASDGNAAVYDISLGRLGENRLTLRFARGYGVYEFFVTLPVRDLLARRGAFIAARQHRDTGKWYEGLLAEYNNETGALLGPDNYDRIKGWRIYEVTCDDPGLSKPAFLSGKNAEWPDEKEIEALEYYIGRFVWGGLQRTDGEEYPYGIYGIPDWHTLRGSADPGIRGQAHLWRIYDYPHLALVYFNLYRIGRRYPEITLRTGPLEYLDRAYRTFLALYQYPRELCRWMPEKTGLYNEMAITGVIEALEAEGRPLAAQRLRHCWQTKSEFFVTARDDVFGSEYPFDTTGYESTQALAEWALRYAAGWSPADARDKADYTLAQAEKFMDYQARCNTACRGVLENAYYLLGSDYRGDSARYTLSYMSQMGGQALLSYALYRAEDPYPLLRLAYASLLSSFALVNAGDEASGWGYWFPGRDRDGAAGGGFESAPYGQTWLEQPHHRGSWYYSCEIDLGFCGYLRGAAAVLCDDPLFGTICLGGVWDGAAVVPLDGVCRRFHRITAGRRDHLLLENARFESVRLADGGYIACLSGVGPGAFLDFNGAKYALAPGQTEITLHFDPQGCKKCPA